MSDDDRNKLTQMIGTLRAIERSSNEGVHLIAGRGDISLELTLEEIETHIKPILEARKSAAGMALASKPKQRTPLIVGSAGSADQQRTSKEAGWRY